MNPLKHFGIKTQFIRGDTKSYNNNNACNICGTSAGDFENCRDCRAQLNLIEKNPNSVESKFYKKELDAKKKMRNQQ